MAQNRDEFMIGIDFKEKQHRENYHRAEAFLFWKFGSHISEINQYIFGSRGPHRGESLESLMVEFIEKVEEELLARTRLIEEQHFEFMKLDAAINPKPIFMRKEELHGQEPEPSK